MSRIFSHMDIAGDGERIIGLTYLKLYLQKMRYGTQNMTLSHAYECAKLLLWFPKVNFKLQVLVVSDHENAEPENSLSTTMALALLGHDVEVLPFDREQASCGDISFVCYTRSS